MSLQSLPFYKRVINFLKGLNRITEKPLFFFVYLLFLLIVSLVFYFRQEKVSFEPFDLLARYFGIGYGVFIGLICSIITLIGFGIINCCFAFCNKQSEKQAETDKNEDSSSEMSSDAAVEKNQQTFRSKLGAVIKWIFGFIIFPLLWITLTALGLAICGFFSGLLIDSSYYRCRTYISPSTIWLKSILILVFGLLMWLLTLLLKKSENASFSERQRYIRFRTGINLTLLSIFITFFGTISLCRPDIPYKDKELKCGVYIYSNNTTYNVTGVNIYSSRCGGFSHSGFLLITKDPKAENAQRRADGLKDLKFIKLQRGYYVNMISMAVPDVDGFTNYQSRCFPMENAYDFDVNALKNYLAGHSPNDLPAPALRLEYIPVTDVSKAWNCIEEFKQTFNKRFPDGMIYSPVPYTDEHVKTINCNTYSAAVIDTLSKEKLIRVRCYGAMEELERFINRFGNFGRQKLADGQQLNKFLSQDDAPDQVKRQWEYVKTTPLNEQNFWANVLRPDGDFGKSLSTLVEKPKD